MFQCIFFTNSRLVINFLAITGVITLLIYFGLLSISIVSVPLKQQMRGTLELDIVDLYQI